MSIHYVWLLALMMCGGPRDAKCDEEYFKDVHHYTMDKCLKIFKDFVKCDDLANDRVSDLRKKCSE
tara:strand:+ start:7076 stop:7273 length:198 start_codon:yes stop_codon:yes gene_type:complete